MLPRQKNSEKNLEKARKKLEYALMELIAYRAVLKKTLSNKAYYKNENRKKEIERQMEAVITKFDTAYDDFNDKTLTEQECLKKQKEIKELLTKSKKYIPTRLMPSLAKNKIYLKVSGHINKKFENMLEITDEEDEEQEDSETLEWEIPN